MNNKSPEVGQVITVSNKFKVQPVQNKNEPCSGCVGKNNTYLCEQLPPCGEISSRTGMYHNTIIFIEDDGEQ